MSLDKMKNVEKVFNFLLILITFVSIWRYIPIVPYNQYVVFLVQFAIICLLLMHRKQLWGNQSTLKYLSLYLTWTSICIIRGTFVADNYFEYKQLVIGGISSVVPLVIYYFDDPLRNSRSHYVWFRASIVMILLFVWYVGFSQYYLSPYLLLFCFFPLIKQRKWRIFVIVMAVFYIFSDLVNRSHIVKASIALFFALVIKYYPRLSSKAIKIGHFVSYLSFPILFLYVLTDATSVLMGTISDTDAVYNNDLRDVRYKDTRSLIIVDVVNSSIRNNYYIWGHTPARGYEFSVGGVLFETQYDNEDKVFNKGERHKNEMVLTNIYTWEGIIGLILYSLLYFRSSYLAVYRSRNRYISLLGCFIAFRWSYGWVEDVNNFYILDISLWAMIALCLSQRFRDMTDYEFELWVNSLVNKKYFWKLKEISIIKKI